MPSRRRLPTLLAACTLAAAGLSCAINPQPEPPGEAQPGSSGAGGQDAGWTSDAGPLGGNGGSTAAGGSGSTTGGGSGAGGSSTHGVSPGAFDESFKDDDQLGPRVDLRNETGASSQDDGGDVGEPGDGSAQD
jgi:hypothetical protein